jgi:hypothetical protein
MTNNEIEIQALITIREGYIAENNHRVHLGESLAYSDAHFFELAEMIRALKEVKDDKR